MSEFDWCEYMADHHAYRSEARDALAAAEKDLKDTSAEVESRGGGGQGAESEAAEVATSRGRAVNTTVGAEEMGRFRKNNREPD